MTQKIDMKVYRANRPRGDNLENLRTQGKFYEYLHLTWALIEFYADNSILKMYCLSSQNPKANPLLDFSIGKKLEMFRKTGCFSQENYDKVYAFKAERNSLFHRGALFLLEESKKDEIMDLAIVAVDVMEALMHSIEQKVLVP
jgi:hypothetical protein